MSPVVSSLFQQAMGRLEPLRHATRSHLKIRWAHLSHALLCALPCLFCHWSLVPGSSSRCVPCHEAWGCSLFLVSSLNVLGVFPYHLTSRFWFSFNLSSRVQTRASCRNSDCCLHPVGLLSSQAILCCGFYLISVNPVTHDLMPLHSWECFPLPFLTFIRISLTNAAFRQACTKTCLSLYFTL